MKKGDKFVCIKKCEIWISEESENYKYDSDISEIGELVEFIAFEEHDQKINIRPTNDWIIISINGDKYSIYKEYFFKYFITLAEWRTKQIDSILTD
jgi:hypothetical protein